MDIIFTFLALGLGVLILLLTLQGIFSNLKGD